MSRGDSVFTLYKEIEVRQQQIDEQLVEIANLKDALVWKDKEMESLSFQIKNYVKYCNYLTKKYHTIWKERRDK